MTEAAPRLPALAVLAGGKATRLGALAVDTPKSLQPIGDRPFLAWQLELAYAQGVRDVVLCVGHLGAAIARVLPEITPPGMRVRCSSDGERALGTGGALLRALPLLSDPFLVLYGDSYLRGDYGRVYATFERLREAQAPGPVAMMTVFHNADRFEPSNIEYADGRILQYEKGARDPRLQHIDWGLGVLTHAALQGFGEAFDLAQVYRQLLAAGRLLGCEVPERFYEIGSPAALDELRGFLLRDAR
ncbi:MAG TPA: NTP transferase domain-containing protein [Polyangiales bacterium]|nr:NTP transferase domain-containing protein [Polyangiales bacterium]